MDGFEILREKWIKVFHTHTRDTQGVHTLNTLLYNMDSMKNDGGSRSQVMEMARGQALLGITDPAAARFGNDRYQTTADEFVEAYAWYFLKYPRLFRQRLEHLCSTVFENIDLNNDGMISFDEYKVFNRSSNLSDETAAKVFALLDANGDGVITKEEYVEINYLKYICDPDVSDKDLPLFG